MNEYNFSDESSIQTLLKRHVQILKILRMKNIVRTTNNPTGDLSEYLFSEAFGWQLAPNSAQGFDATDAAGLRFQIKGRRLHSFNKSRQLGALRNLQNKPFDVLAAIIFNEDFEVIQAALIPWEYVLEKSKYVAHSNSHRFIFKEAYMNDADVEDVSGEIKQVLMS